MSSSSFSPSFSRFSVLLLVLLTALGVVVAGYHPGTEDDGVYLAAIYHNLNPALFCADADFFALQLQATVFDKLVAASVRMLHLPVEVVVLGWHLLTIFGILAACYRIASRCFEHEYARWCGVALVTVFFTLPVAGTALYIVDQSLHPRAICTALVLFAVDCVLGRRYLGAAVLEAVAFLFHPIMAAFGLSLCLFLAVPWPRLSAQSATGMFAAFAIPMEWIFDPTSPAWREAANTCTYYFLTRWAWYEWLGAIAPIFILLWFATLARRREQPVLERLSTRVAVYGVFQVGVALLVMLPMIFERLRPLQPMRYLHLLYIFLILLAGCFIGENFLREHHWRWAALFVPVALVMFFAQRATYPASPHLELPGIRSSNPWLASFEWVRKNTPENAYFVLGRDYLHRPGEDNHGFRALALRSALADSVKDSAVVTQVPRLAARWRAEVAAQTPTENVAQTTGVNDWQQITAADLRRLKAQFGVDWVILERRSTKLALDCPYKNAELEVCRIN
ncbi:MAG: hypothetical protein CXZ00_09420 [Acidobacteria bacterium]|nr:MAG: hypothetical protein CXZ00_09420 [Acidobacteriota bacterium]